MRKMDTGVFDTTLDMAYCCDEQAKHNQLYPETLQRLFRGHPARHLQCTDVQCLGNGSRKKEAITRKYGAQLSEYAKHLDPRSFDGVGALGVIPTFSSNSEERARWFVEFLALDFDSVGLADVMPLIAVLEENRIYVYLDRGTTGRGVHLYIFPSKPLSQREAHTVLVTVANLSKSLKLPYPEFMPSSASGPSRGIFLPYRGAAEDGFGANPLIDPANGTQIPLCEAESEIYETEIEDLWNFVETLEDAQNDNKSSKGSSYNPININTYSGVPKAWNAECTRLKEFWVEGKRQYLALGLTAYGISIGVPDEKIREDIKALERASSNPEIDSRMKAVDGTVKKYVKGERIAWRKFYSLADVEPPRANKVVSWEVLLKLQILEDQLRSLPFKGMGGYTDLDVLDSLIEVGRKYGRLHPEGVEISISTRDLALVARSSNTTIINSLKRLKKAGWVSRSSHGLGTNSGSLVLHIDDEDVGPRNLVTENADEEIMVHIPRFRWGGGKLGKMSRPILQNLQRLQPCTRAALARGMGRKSRDLRNPMNRLLEYRLVEYDEDTNTYCMPSNFEDRLLDVLLINGTLQTDFKHKARFERERKAFRARMALRSTQNVDSYERV